MINALHFSSLQCNHTLFLIIGGNWSLFSLGMFALLLKRQPNLCISVETSLSRWNGAIKLFNYLLFGCCWVQPPFIPSSSNMDDLLRHLTSYSDRQGPFCHQLETCKGLNIYKSILDNRMYFPKNMWRSVEVMAENQPSPQWSLTGGLQIQSATYFHLCGTIGINCLNTKSLPLPQEMTCVGDTNKQPSCI